MAPPVAGEAQIPPAPEPLIAMVDSFVLLGGLLAAAAATTSPTAAALVAGATLAWVVRELLSVRGSSMAGDTVVITGAGSGIGRLVAHRFAHRHAPCKLVLWDLNTAAVEATAAECESMGAAVLAATVDVSDWDTVYAAAKSAIAKFGRVDCLINNAGIVTGMKLLDVPPALAAKTIDVNVKAHIWTTKAFLPGMLERNHGRVVTVASMAGLLGVGGLCDYAASKFGAVGFDESLRMELRSLSKTVSTLTTDAALSGLFVASIMSPLSSPVVTVLHVCMHAPGRYHYLHLSILHLDGNVYRGQGSMAVFVALPCARTCLRR